MSIFRKIPSCLPLLLICHTVFAQNNPCVQQTPFSNGTQNAATAGTYTMTATFPTTPTIGHNIVVFVNGVTTVPATFSSITVTDNQATGGNTYTQDAAITDGANVAFNGFQVYSQLWSAPVTKASGSFVITGHFTSSANQITYDNVVACEAVGMLASPKDQTGTKIQAPGANVVVTAGGTNSQASEFVYTVSVNDTTMTPTTGYATAGNGNSLVLTSTGYKSVTAVEQSAATFPSSSEGVAVLVTYKATAASGPSVIQSTSGAGSSSGWSPSTTTANFPSAVNTGHYIVATAVACNGASCDPTTQGDGVLSASDSLNNGWVKCGEDTINPRAFHEAIFVAKVTTGGTDAVTVTMTGSSSGAFYGGVSAFEVTNTGLSTNFCDVAGVGSGAISGGSASISATTTSGSDFLVSVILDSSNSCPSQPTGYVNLPLVSGRGGMNIGGAAGTQTATYTGCTTGVHFEGIIAAFHNTDPNCAGSSPTWTVTNTWTGVGTCLAVAAPGDTVQVAAGTYTVSPSQVYTVQNGVKLIPQGVVNITDNSCAGQCDVSSHSANMINVVSSPTRSTQFGNLTSGGMAAGFIINQGTAIHSDPNGTISASQAQGNAPLLIIGNTYNMVSSNGDFISANGNYGVVSNNSQFGVLDPTRCLNNASFIRMTGDIGPQSNGSSSVGWNQVSKFGNLDTTGNYKWYIENNLLDTVLESVDCSFGCRAAFRFNTVYEGGPGTHGADTQVNGGRYVEIYNNSFLHRPANSGPNTQCQGAPSVDVNTNATTALRGGTSINVNNNLPDLNTAAWGQKNGVEEQLQGVARNGDQSAIPWLCWNGPTNALGYNGPLYPFQPGYGYLTGTTRVGNSSVFLELEPIYFAGNVGGTVAYPAGNQYHPAVDTGFEGNETCAPISPTNRSNLVATNYIIDEASYYPQDGSFNGTHGTGVGTRASRPATCTTGVAYWSTDQGNWNGSGGAGPGASAGVSVQGVLDKCTSTNTWTNGWYTPYTYPHPLISAFISNALHVAKTGSDTNPCTAALPCLTVSHGISQLGSGGLLYVHVGTYTELVQDGVTTTFTAGTPGNLTTISAFPGDAVKIAAPTVGDPLNESLIYTNHNYIRITGFEIDGASNLFHTVKIDFPSVGVQVDNCDIHNADGLGIGDYNSNNFILNNKLHANGLVNVGQNPPGGYGLYVGGNNNLIQGNEMYGNARYGMQIYSGTAPPSANVVRNNSIHNNEVTLGGAGIIAGGGAHMIYNNLVYGEPGDGIEANVDQPNQDQIVNNTIYNNGGFAVNINLAGAVSINVENNISFNNVAGDFFDSGMGDTFSNNVCGAAGLGCSQVGNPNFVNPTSTPPNFHLQSSSNAIGHGGNLTTTFANLQQFFSNTLTTNDYDGNARPTGTAAWDIGAFNFTGGTPLFVISQQPGNIASGGTFSPAIAGTVSPGNAGDSIVLSAVSGSCNPTGTLTVTTTANGAFVFTGVGANGTPGAGCVFKVHDSSNAAVPDQNLQAFNMTGSLAFSSQPSNTVAGGTFSPTVTVTTTPSSTDAIHVAVTTGSCVLSGTTTVNAVAGVATFTGLGLSNAPTTGCILTASDSNNASFGTITSSSFNTTGSVSFSQGPTNITTGHAFSPVMTVAVSPSTTDTISLAVTAGTCTLGGTTSVAAVAGTATFTGVTGVATGTNCRITATDTTNLLIPAVQSGTFNVSPANTLSFSQQPTNTASGGTFSPVITVTVSASVTDSIVLSVNTGACTLSGTTTVSAVAGVATFTGVGLTSATPTNGCRLQAHDATDSSVANILSSTFNMTGSMAFSQQPTNTASSFAFSPTITVTETPSSTDTIILSVASGTCTFTGTNSRAAVAGVATFTGLTAGTTGTGCTLLAHNSSNAAYSDVTSSTFNITTPSQSFTTQPTNTQSGNAFSPAVVVTLLPAATDSITLSVASGSCGLSGTLTVTANGSGVATFTGVGVTGTPTTGCTLRAHDNTNSLVGNITSSSFNMPGTMSFTTQPTNTANGSTFNPAVTVKLGVAAMDSITLTLNSCSTGALSGSTTISANASGVATFTGLGVTGMGSSCTLTATDNTDSAVSNATSNSFNITSVVVPTMAFTTQPSNTTSGNAFSPTVVLTFSSSVTDSVTLTATGGCTLTGTTTRSASAGVVTWTGLGVSGNPVAGCVLAAHDNTNSSVVNVNSQAFNMVGTMTFSGQPTNTNSGSAFNPTVTVSLGVASADSLTISLQGCSSGSLTGTTTVTANNTGLAIFNGVGVSGSGTSCTLKVHNNSNSAVSDATSSTFNITSVQIVTMSFTQQPTNVFSGATFVPVVTVTFSPSTITDLVTLTLNGCGTALTGSTAVNAAIGVVTYAGLGAIGVASNCTVTAHDLTNPASVADVISSSFNVSPLPKPPNTPGSPTIILQGNTPQGTNPQ